MSMRPTHLLDGKTRHYGIESKRGANTRMSVPHQKKTDGGLLAGGLEQKGEGGARRGLCKGI